MLEKKKIYRISFPVLLILGIALIVLAIYPTQKKETTSNGHVSGIKVENSPMPSPTVFNSPSASVTTKISSPVPSVVVSPTHEPAASNPPTASPSPVNQQTQVNLSVNGGESFTVNVNLGDNQCAVLTKALEQEEISSLNMQYNSSLGSYAVYQINGIGKENSVWWTYTVNGTSPTQGCSYIKANNGDKVEWEYIGQ